MTGNNMKAIVCAVLTGLLAILVLGCGSAFGISENSVNDATNYDKVQEEADGFGKQVYIPHNGVEFNNYNNAQKLFDNPTTIIWCTASFGGSNTSPLITVPVAGKLTSSTTSYFNPQQIAYQHSDSVVGTQSVDGMFHTNPPPYRFGFTPGGQYVDFFNMPTFCTTQPIQFQRQSISVRVDRGLAAATIQAESALRNGDKQKAQALLEQAAGQ